MGKGGTKGKPGGGDGGGGGASSTERWVFFGDSLTDNGLFSDLASAFLTTPVPFQTPTTEYSQSFTNGQVYADTWMALAGTAPENYLNLALGGAEATDTYRVSSYINEYSSLRATNGDVFSIVTDTNPVVSDPTSPYFGAALKGWDTNLGGQVDRYLEFFDDDPQATTTASFFIGANDLSKFEFNIFDYLLFGQVQNFADDIGDAIEAAARRVVADGVDKVILNTLPIANLFYAWDDASSLERDVADDLIDTTNVEILDSASDLRASGIDATTIRIDLIAYELNIDASSYGFATTEPFILGYGGDPQWVETSPGSGSYAPQFVHNSSAGNFRLDQRLFYDEIHPTEALHDVLGIFSHESISSKTTLGSNGGNRLRTGNGDDFVVARDGSDTITLRGGDDVALGGRGNDLIEGGGGSDLLLGGKNSDTILGGEQSDLLAGGRQDDIMDGGGGADILVGGTDGDTMLGGTGNDHFIFIEDDLTAGADTNGATMDGGGGSDTLWLVLSDASLAVLGNDGSASDLARLNLTVTGVEAVSVIDYAALDELAFEDALSDRYEEAQLWGVV